MEQLIGLVLLWIVIGIVVKIVNYVRKRALLAKMPSESEFIRHLESIKNMRAQGASYQDQLNFLLRSGVDKKIAEMILAQVEKESS